MILKLAKIILGSFLSLVFMYMTVSVILSMIPILSNLDSSYSAPYTEIYIVSNGVHTDIVMPISNAIIDWKVIFDHEGDSFLSEDYISVGWGNKDFFLNTPNWSDLTFKLLLTSTFGFGNSVLHISYINRSLQQDGSCVKIILSERQYKNLTHYILNTLKYNDKNTPILLSPVVGYTINDYFYEAKGNYSLFYTCNTWVNDALKVTGQKAALWTPFAKGIFFHYQ